MAITLERNEIISVSDQAKKDAATGRLVVL